MIKNFLSKIRQFKKFTIMAPIFMIFEVAAEVTIPFMMSRLIDEGIEPSDMQAIVTYGAILFSLAVAALFTGTLSGIFTAKASSGFALNLRKDMFENLQRFSFSNIDKFSSSSLITRLTTDVTNVQNAFQAIIRQAVRSVVMIIAAFIMVFRINAQLSLIYLAVMPVLAFGLFFVIMKVHPIFVRALKVYDKLNGVTQENLHAIRVVKSYVRQSAEIKKFDGISTEIYNDFTKAMKRVALNPTLIQLCVYASLILISWLGAKLVVTNQMSTGQLMSFFTYTMQLMMSLMLMSMVFVMIVIARSSAHRVIEILVEEPDIKNPENPVLEVKDGSISFSEVGFSYVNDPEKLCLSEINLHIKSGETIGILGGTGSSKTSLIQLIPRLYDTTLGTLCVGGVNVKDYDINTLRNSVAVVLQKNTLFSGTIRENLKWGNETADDEEIKRVCKLSQADKFIQAFPDGYDTFIEQGGTNVSGGQRQRLCIARALLKNPKVLILDDSTSAVDTATDASLRKAFREELPDITKLIIAQRVTSVMDADKIIIMESGKINAIGTHEELLQNSNIYREIYNTQTQGGGDFDETR